MNDTVCAAGEPPLSLEKECRAFHNRRVKQRAEDADRLGVPLFLSEFGACYDTDECAMEIGLVADACDANMIGWGYWQFKNYWDLTTSAGAKTEGFYNRDGSLAMKKIGALSRTYMPYVQGTLTKTWYSSEDHAYWMSFVLDTDIAQPSVLYTTINTEKIMPRVMVEGKEMKIDDVFVITAEGRYLKLQARENTYNGK